jgi:hypothetical protein
MRSPIAVATVLIVKGSLSKKINQLKGRKKDKSSKKEQEKTKLVKR